MILWNYIADMYYNNVTGEEILDDDARVDKIGKKIYEHYKNKKGVKNLYLIKDSVKDIKAYVRALGKIIFCRENYLKHNTLFDKYTKNGFIALRTTYFLLPDKIPSRGHSNLVLKIQNGKIESCKIYGGAIVKMNEKLEVEKVLEKMAATAFIPVNFSGYRIKDQIISDIRIIESTLSDALLVRKRGQMDFYNQMTKSAIQDCEAYISRVEVFETQVSNDYNELFNEWNNGQFSEKKLYEALPKKNVR